MQGAIPVLGEEEIMFFSLRLIIIGKAMRPIRFSNGFGPWWEEPHLDRKNVLKII